jgi:hypothetical protein
VQVLAPLSLSLSALLMGVDDAESITTGNMQNFTLVCQYTSYLMFTHAHTSSSVCSNDPHPHHHHPFARSHHTPPPSLAISSSTFCHSPAQLLRITRPGRPQQSAAPAELRVDPPAPRRLHAPAQSRLVARPGAPAALRLGLPAAPFLRGYLRIISTSSMHDHPLASAGPSWRTV